MIYNINKGVASHTKRAERNTQKQLQSQVIGVKKWNTAMKKVVIINTLHQHSHTC